MSETIAHDNEVVEGVLPAVSYAQPVAGFQQPAKRPSTAIRTLTVLGFVLALGMFGLGVAMLLDARRDAWHQAEQASRNLLTALSRDIGRNIATYDLSLTGLAEALREPGLDDVSPSIRHSALFDRAAAAEFLGTMLVLDKQGHLVVSSNPMPVKVTDFSSRDYFRIHRDKPDVGMFVSRAFRSTIWIGDERITLSRRLVARDGSFDGIVAGSLRLAYFRQLFETLELGPQGSIAIFRDDGFLIMRRPFNERDIDRSLAGTASFSRFADSPNGQFIGVAAIDKVERLYTYQRIPGLPLILSIALATDDISAVWRPKAIVAGSVMALLCLATLVLCLLFRREMARRLSAEHTLRDFAESVSRLAATDSLTGLANRRAFDTAMQREWRRAARNRSPVALLMLDADCFKLYNDRYGHAEGDRVLRAIACALADSIRRPGDTAGRYGGEEFTVLLPDTDGTGAYVIADRIRHAVASLAIAHEGSPSKTVTVSIGVAVARPVPGDLSSALGKEADAALYEAKQAGRNRVILAGRGDPFPAAEGISMAAD